MADFPVLTNLQRQMNSAHKNSLKRGEEMAVYQAGEIPCNETSDAARLCRNPLVSVHMTTYNHEGFIRQAIEGVVMQETDFEYELVIGEDCSTDRTREICFEYQKKHPTKIRVLWSESNLWHIGGNHKRVDVRCRGKYIAYCEGDDYWTDPKKLQKQVEYMESHPGCAGCFHERVKCDEEGQIMEGTGLPDEMKRPLTGEDIVAWTFPCPPTCTVLYRREVVMDRPAWMNGLFFGDRATAIWGGYAHGTVDWVAGVDPSVYRIHRGGVYRGKDLVYRFLLEHAFSDAIMQHFPVSRAVREVIYRTWKSETFWGWRKWHANESAEIRYAVSELVRQDIKAAPSLRWYFMMKKYCYWMERVRAMTWHGFVLGLKSAMPKGAYGKLRLAWRVRRGEEHVG